MRVEKIIKIWIRKKKQTNKSAARKEALVERKKYDAYNKVL